MSFRRRYWALCLPLCAVLDASNANAIVCSPAPDYCHSCGVALMRPLAERVVSPRHEIDVVVSCYGQGNDVLPSLWTSDGLLPSDWAPLGTSYPEENSDPDEPETLTLQRFRRLGPALPAGARVTLGTLGPSACQLLRQSDCSGNYSNKCAPNPEVDCCDRATDRTPSPLLSFDVGAEPEPAIVSAGQDAGVLGEPGDAGGDAGARSSESDAGVHAGARSSTRDAGVLGSARDAGVDVEVLGEPGDAAAPKEAGTPRDAGDAATDTETGPAYPRADTLPFELRCVDDGVRVLFYLDVGAPVIDDAIVEIDFAWSREGSPGGSVTWYSQPCLGQSSRRFDAYLPGFAFRTQSEIPPNGEASYQYELRARGEAGPVAEPETGTLSVPTDCVAPTELGLSWHNASFAVFCNASNPESIEITPTELEETRSTGTCSLPESDDGLLVYTESHSPAVATSPTPVSSVPSAVPVIIAQAPTTSDGCTLSRGVGSPRGNRLTLFAGVVFLLGLGWLRALQRR